MTVTYTVGETREVIKGIPDGSVDLIASSPPFLALRSYVPAGHESKGDEIGSERNPAEFLDMLLGLTAEWGRVLAAHGSIAIELGDTYSRSGGTGSPDDATGHYTGRQLFAHSGAGWPDTKSLALIPQLYAVALAYGINPLTGAPSPAGRWLVRNVIVWHRPNPAVGALGDKVRPSTSYIVVATRSAKRWFDLTAVRGEASPNTHARLAQGVEVADRSAKSAARGNFATMPELATTAGAPPLDAWFDPYDGTHDTWTLTTQPSRLAHYAMWPAKLAERLILSMCPREVCRQCGEPRRRVEGSAAMTGAQPLLARAIRTSRLAKGLSAKEVNGWFGPSKSNWIGHWEDTTSQPLIPTPEQWAVLRSRLELDPALDAFIVSRSTAEYTPKTAHGLGWADSHRNARATENLPTLKAASVHRPDLGWTDCGHDNYRPGLVLDPFAGSGTTCAVADLHGRDAIGIDFDARNKAIYPARYDEVKRALYGTPAPMPGQETFDFAI